MTTEKFTLQLQQYPSISDLEERAAKRVVHVGWEYLSMGTGDDRGVSRNREGLDNVTILPQFMKGKLTPNLETTLFGRTYQAPFGVAPVGLGGIIWPGVEKILAATANKYQIPYTLSTVATHTPETIVSLVGEMGWFQLYPPHEPDLRADILQRAKDAGFHTLVVTADVPAASRRERSSRAGLRMPPAVTPRFLWQGMMRPQWSIETLRAGLPNLRTLQKYTNSNDVGSQMDYLRDNIGGTLSWDYLKEVRDWWDGPLVVKGIMHPDDAEAAIGVGVDGIQVSNHGARQFNGTPAAIDALPAIVDQVNGRASILFDSGIRSGLDIMRALALGADFVLLGRAFMFGVGAFGKTGGDHVVEILLADLIADMHNIGVESVAEMKGLRTADKMTG